MSIGAVLSELRGDFPDVSISKIRFLEAEGLIEPERTSAGYRKFSAGDMDKLRYILEAQRDQYLPLRVIKEHLEAMDRGLEPPSAPGGHARAPQATDAEAGVRDDEASTTKARPPAVDRAQLQMSADELVADTGLKPEQLSDLVAYGIVTAQAGTDYFDGQALDTARIVSGLTAFGLEPRHIRVFKTAADRELGLIEQLVSAIGRQRGADAPDRASDAAEQLGALALRLHSALIKAGLRDLG